ACSSRLRPVSKTCWAAARAASHASAPCSQTVGKSSVTRVAVALGSNLGDRDGYLRSAIAALQSSIDPLRVSTFHDTAPVGVGPQPIFLNAAAVGETS